MASHYQQSGADKTKHNKPKTNCNQNDVNTTGIWLETVNTHTYNTYTHNNNTYTIFMRNENVCRLENVGKYNYKREQ